MRRCTRTTSLFFAAGATLPGGIETSLSWLPGIVRQLGELDLARPLLDRFDAGLAVGADRPGEPPPVGRDHLVAQVGDRLSLIVDDLGRDPGEGLLGRPGRGLLRQRGRLRRRRPRPWLPRRRAI